MTYKEFGEKYLTPPERHRYFHNILTMDHRIDVHDINENKPKGRCFFCDTFSMRKSPEEEGYWQDIEHKILGYFDTTL